MVFFSTPTNSKRAEQERVAAGVAEYLKTHEVEELPGFGIKPTDFKLTFGTVVMRKRE